MKFNKRSLDLDPYARPTWTSDCGRFIIERWVYDSPAFFTRYKVFDLRDDQTSKAMSLNDAKAIARVWAKIPATGAPIRPVDVQP